ncbi:unnamed protein product [Acanthoscelides obtectus]|nr:unnamed protein product [Acanthoscelides obtectus]CAK1626327.1 hypothetical protein AOBTE_LOCUS3782 [Acanthoscelides obtectus]
MGHKLS